MTPDALPVIDRVPGIEGLIVAAGFSGHGFGTGPAVGEALSELALRNDRVQSLANFAFDRFTTGVPDDGGVNGGPDGIDHPPAAHLELHG